MASVAWNLLTADHMGWAWDPILREFAVIAKDVFVHLMASWQVYLTKHTLLQSYAAHIILISSWLADLSVNTACCLTKLIIFEWYEACVAGKVLAGPQVGCFGSMFWRLWSRLHHYACFWVCQSKFYYGGVRVFLVRIQRDKSFNCMPEDVVKFSI